MQRGIFNKNGKDTQAEGSITWRQVFSSLLALGSEIVEAHRRQDDSHNHIDQILNDILHY